MKTYIIGIDNREIEIQADRVEITGTDPAKFYQKDELVSIFAKFDYIIDISEGEKA